MLNKKGNEQLTVIIGGVLRDQWHAQAMNIRRSAVVTYNEMIGHVLAQGLQAPVGFKSLFEVTRLQVVETAMKELAATSDEVVQMKTGCKWINV